MLGKLRKKAKELILKYLPIISKRLPYIYLILAIISSLLNFLLKNIGVPIYFEAHANVLTVIYGVTAGILTIIGLIAIYISVNIQYNIQKCKEISWELEEFSPNINTVDDLTIASRDIKKQLKMYINLLNRSGNNFNEKIIDLTQLSILTVSMIWLISVNLFLLPNQSLTEYLIVLFVTFICTIILSKFSIVIGEMKEFQKFGGLISPVDFINHKGLIGIRRILLLSHLKARNGGLSIGSSIIDFSVSTIEILVFDQEGNETILPFKKQKQSHILSVTDKEIPPGLRIPNDTRSCIYRSNDFFETFTTYIFARGRRNHAFQYRFPLPKLTLSNEVKYDKSTDELFLTNNIRKMSIRFRLHLYNEPLKIKEEKEKKLDEILIVDETFDISYLEEKGYFEVLESQMDDKSIMEAYNYSINRENKY